MDSKPDFDATQNKLQQEQHIHVLAVDDSIIDRKLLEKLLTVSSYQVTCVESGDKALEFLGLVDNNENDSTTCSSLSPSLNCTSKTSEQELQGSKVNLIMTDYSMPGMSGYDLLKIVKGSSWKDVPVVVMSSENVPSRINMCLEEGAEEFLLKPVKLSDLRKLQSQLHNSIGHAYENNDNLDENEEDRGSDEHVNSDDKSDNNVNKRKAISSELSERRPKMKDIIVL